MIQTTVSAIKTTPYTKSELENLQQDKVSDITDFGLERVVGEEILEKFNANTITELREKVYRICSERSWEPVVVMTDNPLKDSFIVGTEFKPDEPEAVFEMIIYHLDEHEQTGKHGIQDESKVKISELLEMLKVIKRGELGNRSLTPQENELAKLFEKDFEHMPNAEVQSILAEIASIQVNKLAKSSKENTRRAEPADVLEIRGSTPHYLHAERALVICRIVGKDLSRIQKFAHYCASLYGNDRQVYQTHNVLPESKYISIQESQTTPPEE